MLKNIVEIGVCSSDYPKEWQDLADKPERLYAVGNITLLKERKFTVVGSRTTPANALKLGTKITEELTSAFVIVTGTADGGDTAAIEGALKGGGRIICLLAGAPDAGGRSHSSIRRGAA